MHEVHLAAAAACDAFDVEAVAAEEAFAAPGAFEVLLYHVHLFTCIAFLLFFNDIPASCVLSCPLCPVDT